MGTVAGRVKLLKMFSISTSIAGACLLPKIYVELGEQYSAPAKMAVMGVTSFFVFMSPVLVHLLSKRYVAWIYYDEETNKFSASTFNFISMEVVHTFTPEDVVIVHGALSSIKVRGVPLLFDANSFFDRKYYKKIMGFDKPAEWMLSEEELAEEERREEREKSQEEKDPIQKQKQM